MSVIKTEHLTYTYGIGMPFEKTAIHDVNIEIEEGELVGVIGHTGSGKSTLISHLNGLFAPTSGKVLLNGRDIWEDPKKIRDIRFQVGLVFQYPEHQLFEETVRRDIAYGPTNMGLPQEEIEVRVQQAAEFVGLRPETLDKSPFELSGGQKRRAAIAGVIAMNPRVLILDEPTAGLDPKGRDRILGQVQEYHRQVKNTVLLVSHNMEDVARFASKVLVMNKGTVAMYGPPQEIFERAQELTAMGLNIPQTTRIFMGLRARGFDLPRSVFTPQQGKEALCALLEKGGKRP